MTALSLYYPTAQPAIAPSIVVRKERVLPIPGDIMVRQGARVEPDDIVARALLPGMPRAVEVASVLGVPAAEGLKTFSKEVGASVQEGEVLAARRVGLARRLAVKSPIDGVLSRYDGRTGQAIITPVSTPLDLPAALNGFVAEQVAYRGVIIENSCGRRPRHRGCGRRAPRRAAGRRG